MLGNVANPVTADQAFSPGNNKTSASPGCANYSDPNGPGCRIAQTYKDGTSQSGDTSLCVTYQELSGGPACVIGDKSVGNVNGYSIEVSFVRILGCSTSAEVAPTTQTYNIHIGVNTGRVNPGSLGCADWNVNDVIVSGTPTTPITSAIVNVSGAHYASVQYASFGPLYAAVNKTSASFINSCSYKDIPSGVQTYNNSDHIVYDHDKWHDYHDQQAGSHMECIHWQGGDWSNVTNSVFTNCGQQPISVQPEGGYQSGCASCVDSAQHDLIEGNVLDQPCSNPGVGDVCTPNGTIADLAIICQLSSGTISDFGVDYNSLDFGSIVSMQNNTPSTCTYSPSGVDFLGNVLPNCGTNNSSIISTNEYNVTKAAACAGTGNVVNATAGQVYNSPLFPNYDYTNPGGSPALNAVAAGQARPTLDLVGITRNLVGAATNAGAYGP